MAGFPYTHYMLMPWIKVQCSGAVPSAWRDKRSRALGGFVTPGVHSRGKAGIERSGPHGKVRFRKKAILRRTFEALKVGKNTIFWDSELAGFGVRGHATGRKVCIGQTRADGREVRWVTASRHGVITPQEARRRSLPGSGLAKTRSPSP